MNNLAIADALERIGLDIGADVVDELALSAERPPSVAQVHEAGRAVRAAQRAPEPDRYALAAPGGIDMPDDVKSRIDALHESWAEEKERDFAAEDQTWRHYVRQVVSGPRISVCNGSGLVPEERDGKLVCPGCGAPVPDLVVHLERKA